MWSNPQFPADFVTSEEILMENFIFCAGEGYRRVVIVFCFYKREKGNDNKNISTTLLGLALFYFYTSIISLQLYKIWY